jgi:hypothetical protein
MDWMDRAKKLKDEFIQRDRPREAKEEENRRESKRVIEVHDQAVGELSPKVEKVCKAFAEGINGKVWSNADIWDTEHNNPKPVNTADLFEVIGPPDGYEVRSRVHVEIHTDGVLLKTREYTEEFFAKLHPVANELPWEPPPSSFFRRKESVQSDDYWFACYFIPRGQFSEDKLGRALDVLCRQIVDPNATIFKD